MIRTFSQGIASLIFPPNCLVCRDFFDRSSSKDVLCPKCLNLILRNQPPSCPCCNRPAIHQGVRCRECLAHPPHYDFAWSACLYNDFFKTLLLEFKYNHKTVLRHTFARCLIEHIDSNAFDIRQFEAIAPIPLHPARFRERGYNQSQLLAESLSRTYKIPLASRLLQRTRPTPSQTLLNEKDRWTNIRGAFRINPLYGRNLRKILIVDDLLTTGATVSEAARALKTARVKQVGVLTLATAGS